MCKLLEYGKIEVWVFLRSCFGLFLFLLGFIEVSVFSKYFTLRMNLFSSLQFLPLVPVLIQIC